MNAINYSTARKELAQTMEQVCRDSNPVIITKNNNCAVVMISLADYESMVETEYLLRSPANARRLRQSLASAERGETRETTIEELEARANAKSAIHP